MIIPLNESVNIEEEINLNEAGNRTFTMCYNIYTFFLYLSLYLTYVWVTCFSSRLCFIMYWGMRTKQEIDL